MSKNVIITGTSSGIGYELVKIFSEKNYEVLALSRDNSKLRSQNLSGVTSINFDLTDYENYAELDEYLKSFKKIDVLINNAGITKDNLLMRMSEDDFEKVIKVNLNSVFNMTKACLRHFLKNRNGSIINMSSVVGVKGNAGQSNYAASKSGIIGFSKSIALELGSRNIRCNVIAPGFIVTEMTDKLSESVTEDWINNIPLKRSGNPVDVANVCIFLASDLSSYITGQVINVDGGLLT